MVQVAEEKHNAWVERLEGFLANLTGGGPKELPAVRRAAIERFAELGFPTTRHEEWKYTNVATIRDTDFETAASYASHGFDEKTVDAMAFDIGDSHKLVFVNGLFSPEMSDIGKLPEGVRIDSLAACLGSEPAIEAHLAKYASYQEQSFVALNTAYLRDGLFLHVPRGKRVEKPVHVIFVGAAPDKPTACHPRNLIVCDENSEAAVVETHLGRDGEHSFTNAVTEIALAKNARLQHYKVNRSGDAAAHVATLQVHQERDSVFYSQNIHFGGALTRNDINTFLDGEGVDSTFDGLFVVSGEQHVDNHTRVDHAKPHGVSHELYKGILDGKATSCFNGKIFVHEDAQKTDAFQQNMNLLMSTDSQANTKPQLEIFADDVKCSHGATVGQLDTDALFYLRARGIPEPTAKALLTYAFANDVVQRIKVEPLRQALDDYLFHELPESRFAR